MPVPPKSESDTMTAWFLFGILAFLVFGVPLIDDLYKMKIRRKARAAGQISDESPSLVPNVNQENLIDSDSRFVKAPEKV